ncbi:TolC family protein [Ornithobacterium rhinotracheale]|uniref:TolC family protein n=1 Tax=Ornithobacterium rhinotracheale TaxID=28251 RepID=UPI00129CE431|nr:TolC family protein [Ornithobacterium rhinotracheale]MRJ09849.1 TolC family protein [Ornithobacterium rhinotracheale]
MKHTIIVFLVFMSVQGWAQQTLSLEESLALALKNNPEIRKISLATEKQNAERLAAWGQLLPRANVGANRAYSFGSTIDPQTNTREALNVSQDRFYFSAQMNLFSWENLMQLKLTQLQKNSFRYFLQATEQRIAMQVVQHFYSYLLAKKWEEILTPQIQEMEKQVQQTQQAVEIGTRPQSDVYDIEANKGNLSNQLLQAQNAKNIAKNNLLLAMGMLQDSVEFAEKNDNLIDFLDLEKIDNLSILANNPEARKAEAEQKIAKQTLKKVQALRLPRLSAQYQWGTFYSKILDSDSPTQDFKEQWKDHSNQYLSLGIEIPIFNQFLVKSETQKAKIEQLQADVRNDAITLKINHQLNEIKNNYHTAWNSYELLKTNHENQRLAFERSEDKFKEGLIDAYTLFIIKNNWLQANYQLYRTKIELQMQQKLWQLMTQNR